MTWSEYLAQVTGNRFEPGFSATDTLWREEVVMFKTSWVIWVLGSGESVYGLVDSDRTEFSRLDSRRHDRVSSRISEPRNRELHVS